MKLLEERIRREGSIRPGGILKVDSFLNHQIDTALLYEISKEFKRLFGNERMLDALNRDPDAEPETLLRTVRQEVDEFTGEAPQFDDITMLGLKYLGPQQQA